MELTKRAGDWINNNNNKGGKLGTHQKVSQEFGNATDAGDDDTSSSKWVAGGFANWEREGGRTD